MGLNIFLLVTAKLYFNFVIEKVFDQDQAP